MNVLILSCDTGGGHNSAARSIQKELIRRGHQAVFLNPFELSGKRVAGAVGGAYVKLVQKHPRAFGMLYKLGAFVSRLPGRSPVYYANSLVARHLAKYLEQKSYDAIVMPHLYPAEMISYLKRKGWNCPKSVYVATDYTCIPFTGETECDYYVIPHEELELEFVRKGVKKQKLRAFGIPVDETFCSKETKQQAREKLGMSEDGIYYLVAGGSIGAGKIQQLLDLMREALEEVEQAVVICGRNKKLEKKLRKRYAGYKNISIIGSTDQMATYMRACDVLYSKPGGLSSTEAAVIGIPLIHLTPIPGCETRNRIFFRKHGMCLAPRMIEDQLLAGRKLMKNTRPAGRMIENQQNTVAADAAERICNLLEQM